MKKYAAFAVGVTLAGLVGVVPAHGTTTTPGVRATKTAAVHWGHCPTDLYPDLDDTGVTCAALKVPEDYAKPNGATITLEISRIRHTSSAAHYKGVILANPGGPGGAGLDLPTFLEPNVPHNVGADYDWIGWDPRGVGASKPAIRCDPSYFDPPRRSYRPTTKSLLKYWIDRSKAYANACESKYGALLNNMTTIDSAKDMESIRKALGVSKISYYGFSYGTYLGQVYSTLYPRHLKYMVLDSNVDPRRVWYGANLDQDKAFNRNIHIYFSWVAKYNTTYHLGSTEKSVSALYYKDLATLTKHPNGKLGPDEWQDAMENAAYYRSTWEDLASAWKSYAKYGRPNGMVEQAAASDATGDDNEFAVYNAVQCTDTQWPTTWSRWKRDNDRYYKKYPFLTWSNAWFNAPCLFWKGKVHKPTRINGHATSSVLLIDETLDAATPYSGSLEVRKLYPHSSLLAEPGGTTHADSLSGDACVDDIVARYLKTGHRPARRTGNRSDTTCKPLPMPVPGDGDDLKAALDKLR